MPLVSQDLTLWQELVDQAHAYQQANQAFFQNCQDRLAIIKKALHHPTQRKTALDFCGYLTLEERQSLLDDLVELASVGHSDIEQVRQIILSLPQDWLLNNIENSANQVLEKATDEEYRRLLELYVKIHISITRKLIKQALNSDDPDIHEVGQDFDDYLKKTLNYKHRSIPPKPNTNMVFYTENGMKQGIYETGQDFDDRLKKPLKRRGSFNDRQNP